MSYWVYLEDRTKPVTCSFGGEPCDDFERKWGACEAPCYPFVEVMRHAEGGTYVVGGTDKAELNVTYNYGGHFNDAWEHAGGTFDGKGDGTLGEMLGEKRAGDVLPFLIKAVEYLGQQRYSDYWKATKGNAGAALAIVRDWAEQHPDAVFKVS